MHFHSTAACSYRIAKLEKLQLSASERPRCMPKAAGIRLVCIKVTKVGQGHQKLLLMQRLH